jgi:hypothetical protein
MLKKRTIMRFFTPLLEILDEAKMQSTLKECEIHSDYVVVFGRHKDYRNEACQRS